MIGSGLTRTSFPLMLLAGWFVIVAGGFFGLFKYENSVGTAGVAPLFWPAESKLEHIQHMTTLIMVVHPQCPCTRASIEELAVFMTRFHGTVEAQVLFILPPQFEAGWEKTGTWYEASAIPGVRVTVDPDGREARRFGAQTSGQALIYDQHGRLIFKGGITGQRGHAGDNANLDAAIATLTGDENPTSVTPVYGCALNAPQVPKTASAAHLRSLKL